MSTTIQEGSALADELLQQIGETVGDRAKASTIFGEPVEREGITVIPVAKAKFGFGGGGGKRKHGPGRGGGGGAAVSPLGYIELRDGTAQFKPITRPTELLAVVAAASLLTLALTRLSAEFQRITRRRRRFSLVALVQERVYRGEAPAAGTYPIGDLDQAGLPTTPSSSR